MPACQRSTDDPLLKTFLDKYHLNLLAVPRDGAQPGDLYVTANGRVSSAGFVGHFLKPALEMPEVRTKEVMADVSGMSTSAVAFSAGLELMQGFFAAVGLAGMLESVGAEYAKQKTRVFRFSFREPLRDSVDPGSLGSKLIRCRFQKDHPLVNEGNRYYLVTGVARSKSLSVRAEAHGKNAVNVDVKALMMAKAHGKLDIDTSAEGEVTYSAKKPLAFGVELYELSYDPEQNKMKMLLPAGAIAVRSVGSEAPGASPLKPALLGGEQGDAFIDLEA
jgi:hypothetical protein